MDKDFAQFLANRPRKERFDECNHGEDMWCQNCIAKPQEVSVELPDGTISTGYVLQNTTNE